MDPSLLSSTLILLFKTEKIDLLVVGLGNPGEEYFKTLHNVGFDVIDSLSEKLSISYWKSECGALSAKAKIGDNTILLAKPQSYMNTSGGPVSEICKKYKISANNMIVVHDDLDLEPGTFRAKSGGGAGGHNGIKSIQQKLATQNFIHFKVGIGHPPPRKSVTDWVLNRPISKFAEAHLSGIETCVCALQCYVEYFNLEEVQRRFN